MEITFDFVPTYVQLISYTYNGQQYNRPYSWGYYISSNYDWYSGINFNLLKTSYIPNCGFGRGSTYGKKSDNGLKFYWYSTDNLKDGSSQYNKAGEKYYWLALGI